MKTREQIITATLFTVLLAGVILLSGCGGAPKKLSHDQGMELFKAQEKPKDAGEDIIPYQVYFSKNNMAGVKTFEILTIGEDWYWCMDEEDYHLITDSQKEKILTLFEDSHLKDWNGFNGVAEGICDGGGFQLLIVLTDQSMIRATGENEYPDNFNEVVGGIDQILDLGYDYDDYRF